MQAEITNYFKANFPDGFMSASVDGPYFTIDSETRTITVTGSAKIPTGFMKVLGKDNIVTSDQRVREVVDRLGVIPVTFYKDGAFAVQAMTQPSAGGESTKAQEAAFEMIDSIVERLKTKRQ